MESLGQSVRNRSVRSSERLDRTGETNPGCDFAGAAPVLHRRLGRADFNGRSLQLSAKER
jgi:hypothetical protein